MVPLDVPRLVLLDWLRQQEGAPVGDAADDAVGGENEGAGRAGDSRGGGLAE